MGQSGLPLVVMLGLDPGMTVENLAVHHWQIAHAEERLRQAEADEFATEEEASTAFAR